MKYDSPVAMPTVHVKKGCTLSFRYCEKPTYVDTNGKLRCKECEPEDDNYSGIMSKHFNKGKDW